ncbi:CUE domain-containing protein [Hirsutella rhossiliensis]
MSEVASRPAASRGRGSGRGGRGGFAGRGARRINGDKSDHKPADDSMAAFDDEGDFAELRKQYGDKTSVIREMFPDWSEADVLFALQETNGDQNEAVARIAEGTISQWGEVSKPKKTTRAKAAKDPNHAPAAPDPAASNPRNIRGGRAVSEGGRGRARGSDRGGRGGRGRPANAGVNGTRNKENQQLSVPTEESSAWDNEQPNMDNADPKPAVAAKPTTHDAPQSAAPQAKTWASMLRQSTAPKAAVAPKEPLAPKPAETTELQPTAEPVPPEPEAAEPIEETTPVAQNVVPAAVPTIAEPEITLPSARAELTETNLEQSPVSASATPLSAAQHQHQTQRTATSGFAASAIKATAERSARTPSHQRRVLDQEEAVRMPGNREVDRAAVQFGAFNLYGGDEDIDGEREEPETRAQPPADSPVAHPRASLPPVSQPVAVPEAYPQKPAAAMPASASGVAATTPAAHPPAPSAQQYGRFGHGGAQDVAATSQKPADPFSHQSTSAAQPPFENFGTQSSQPQAQQPGAAGAYSSAPSEYSNYYTANQPERNPYNFYGQQYGSQQGAHGQHEGGVPSQQRPFGGYNAQNDNLSQYPQSGAMHGQPRFGASSESQNSGHSTPNPTAQAQQQQQAQQPQAQQPQQQGAPGTQPQSHGQQYPGYSHPYYSNPYYHQYYSGYGQGGFGPYGGKGGMYGQPYGVSPNAPYEQHASSPGTFGPSSLHRESGLGSGLGDYGRAASGQAGNQPGLGGTSFGGSHDSFARGASSFQSQGQSFNSQGQPPASGSSDELKSYGEAKAGSGPSPSLGGGPRPGSAANNAPGQSGLPPPQTSQMGGASYGGYPSHLQGHGLHGGSGYGGAASQHGSTPYGSYGQGFGSGGYYGGGQQQRGGWGGNYH